MLTIQTNTQQRMTLSLISVSLLIAVILYPITTPYMSMATFAYLLMCSGLLLRGSTNIHPKLMLVAILTDLSLVLLLEMQRGATQTALSMTLSPVQQFHILCSSLATVLYFPVMFLGWKRWTGQGSSRMNRWHLKLGISAFVFRTLGFILMFTLLNHVGR